MSSRGRRWWLCVAPAVACALDASLTLVFQPETYWTGGFAAVNEISPIDRWMLMQHPIAFAVWVATWIVAFSVVIRCLSARVGMAVAITLILGNVSGAYSWVSWRVPAGFWVSFGMNVFIAALVVVTWAKAGVLTSSTRDATPDPTRNDASGDS